MKNITKLLGIIAFIALIGTSLGACASGPQVAIVGTDYKDAVVHQLAVPIDRENDPDYYQKTLDLLKATEVYEFTVNTKNPKRDMFFTTGDELEEIWRTMDHVRAGSYGRWRIKYLNGTQNVRWYVYDVRLDENGVKLYRCYAVPN